MFIEGEFLILLLLFLIALLYSSVGHGGASGYLAVLSLTIYAEYDSGWLKQHAWALNLVVAAIAFYHYRKAGFFNLKLTLPFILGSIPFAIIGGYLRVDGVFYDTLLSITLVWAAYKLLQIKEVYSETKIEAPGLRYTIPIGGGVGLMSGVIGVGGGIFLSPILLLKKWADPKTAAATAALFIWVNSIAGLVGAGISGQLVIQIDVLFPFIMAVLLGGYIGAKYGSENAHQSLIRKLLIIVLIVASLKRISYLMI